MKDLCIPRRSSSLNPWEFECGPCFFLLGSLRGFISWRGCADERVAFGDFRGLHKRVSARCNLLWQPKKPHGPRNGKSSEGSSFRKRDSYGARLQMWNSHNYGSSSRLLRIVYPKHGPEIFHVRFDQNGNVQSIVSEVAKSGSTENLSETEINELVDEMRRKGIKIK